MFFEPFIEDAGHIPVAMKVLEVVLCYREDLLLLLAFQKDQEEELRPEDISLQDVQLSLDVLLRVMAPYQELKEREERIRAYHGQNYG